jgi:trans-aconitate 2-methyltransferase
MLPSSELQWVKKQRKALELIRRSLKRGRRIAFQLPAKSFCREFFEYAADAITLLSLERYFKDWEKPWYLPDKEEYASVLKKVGFRKVDVFYGDYRLVFESANRVLDWWTSAGLGPYLQMLPEE